MSPFGGTTCGRSPAGSQRVPRLHSQLASGVEDEPTDQEEYPHHSNHPPRSGSRDEHGTYPYDEKASRCNENSDTLQGNTPGSSDERWPDTADGRRTFPLLVRGNAPRTTGSRRTVPIPVRRATVWRISTHSDSDKSRALS